MKDCQAPCAGGYPWGLGASQYPINRDWVLIPRFSLNSTLLHSGWIHLFADPGLRFVDCFHPPYNHTHIYSQRSMPPFRPSIDLITVLSTFFPPPYIYKTPAMDRAYQGLPSLAFTCRFFLPVDLIVLSHRPIHTSRAQI